ncbi:MAG: hypothetical protein JNL98_02770 [Bryobacterales bacterium]|nr:hypothetical protein [Bryobacterales bacterium]
MNRLFTSSILSQVCFLLVLGQNLPAAAIRIVSPAEGAQFRSSDVFVVAVELDASIRPRRVMVGARDLHLKPPVPDASPYHFRIEIPAKVAGRRSLVAAVITESGATIESSPVGIYVDPQVAVRSLTIRSAPISFEYVGKAIKLDIGGTIDGDVVGIDLVDACTYESTDTSVVRVAQDGSVIAWGVGSSRIVARFKGLSTAVDVQVVQTMRGDLNGDQVIDQEDVLELQEYVNTTATCPNDARDLNRDGKIDALDARILTTLCTNPRCAP